MKSLHSLAQILKTKGDLAGAAHLLRNVLAHTRILHGDAHLGTLSAIEDLAALFKTTGDFRSREPLLREVCKLTPKKYDPSGTLMAIPLGTIMTVLSGTLMTFPLVLQPPSHGYFNPPLPGTPTPLSWVLQPPSPRYFNPPLMGTLMTIPLVLAPSFWNYSPLFWLFLQLLYRHLNKNKIISQRWSPSRFFFFF